MDVGITQSLAVKFSKVGADMARLNIYWLIDAIFFEPSNKLTGCKTIEAERAGLAQHGLTGEDEVRVGII